MTASTPARSSSSTCSRLDAGTSATASLPAGRSGNRSSARCNASASSSSPTENKKISGSSCSSASSSCSSDCTSTTQSSPSSTPSACWRASQSPSSSACGTEISQASAPAAAASAGLVEARQRIGSSISSRRSSTGRLRATASAPCAAAALAASASATSTIREMPSPSEIAWLNFTAEVSLLALLADRVPHGLELEEGGDLPRALSVGVAADDTLDVFSCRTLEVRRIAIRTRQVECVHVHVSCKPRSQLAAMSGQEIDNTARHVRRRKRLGELDCRERPRLRRDGDHNVAADQSGQDARQEPEERRLVRRDHGDDPGRLGHGEVEIRAGNRVRAAEHLGQLVRPARVPHDAIDAALDLFAAAA